MSAPKKAKRKPKAPDRLYLRSLMRQHERLMSTPPYPHDGHAFCQCEIAKVIRKLSGAPDLSVSGRTKTALAHLAERIYERLSRAPRAGEFIIPLIIEPPYTLFPGLRPAVVAAIREVLEQEG